MALLLDRIIVGWLQTNCYIVTCEVTGFTFIIDPGDNPHAISSYLLRNTLYPKGIILTHAHPDHIGGVDMLLSEFRMDLMLHPEEIQQYETVGKRKVTRFLFDGMLLQLGRCKFRIIHTPGHTPGSVCIYGAPEDIGETTPILFSGDTLFKDGVGRTDLPGGSMKELENSLIKKVFTLSGETCVYPGHGESTTIMRERWKSL